MRNKFIFLSVSFLAGCSANPTSDTRSDADLADDLQEDTTARSAWDGTPEGIGSLDLLNDEFTTDELLDIDVALDRRAAGNLIAHRDGGDHTWGTSDDDLFNSMEEVDAVRWVGPSAIGKIVDYADAMGWVPSGDDVLGTWDGVTFTVDEADLTIELVNSASAQVLDDDIPLDRRAVNSILDARPLDSVAELAGLYFVGNTALERLKAYAEEDEDVVFEDQFNHDEELDIPDDDTKGIEALVHVAGVPDVEVEITVVADFQHDAPEDLEIELTAPDGEVWDLTNGLASVNQIITYTEDPNGYWTLRVADTAAGNEGTLWGWALEIRTPDNS